MSCIGSPVDASTLISFVKVLCKYLVSSYNTISHLKDED